MMLLVDCGNSRIKWAHAGERGLEAPQSCVHLGRVNDALSELESSVAAGVDRAIVANVAGKALENGLESALSDRLGLDVHFVRTPAESHGVRVAYRDPASLGVDRWLAMVAALRGRDGDVCVVSAGTAVTIDALAADGSHLGGLILVGPRLAAEALAAGTQGIGPTMPGDDRPSGIELFAATTNEAVGRGSLLAIASAVDRAVKIMTSELGREPAVLLTGGDAGRIEPWLECRVSRHPDLVLEGLLCVGETLGRQDA